MSFVTQAEAANRDAKAQYAVHVQKFLNDVYAEYPTLVRCTANDRMLVELVQHFAGHTEVVPTLELYCLALGENEGFINQTIASAPLKDRRDTLVDEIVELIKQGGPRLTQHDIKTFRVKFSYFTVQQLEDKKAELIEKHRLAKLRPSEIRQGLANARAGAQPQRTRPVLPAEYTPRNIKKASREQVAALIRQFGASAINDRLFGRSYAVNPIARRRRKENYSVTTQYCPH